MLIVGILYKKNSKQQQQLTNDINGWLLDDIHDDVAVDDDDDDGNGRDNIKQPYPEFDIERSFILFNYFSLREIKKEETENDMYSIP